MSESLPKNNAVCSQLRLSAGDIMSCVTPGEGVVVNISLSLIVSEEPEDFLDVVSGSSLTQYIFTWTSSAAAPRSLLARLALFMKPSITHI